MVRLWGVLGAKTENYLDNCRKFNLRIKMDYDSVGDVLYISFSKPRPVDDSDITDEGVIIRLWKGRSLA